MAHATPVANLIGFEEPVLALSFELSKKRWVLEFRPSLSTRVREVIVPAGDLDGISRQIARAKEHFELPADFPTVSCFEAGRDGFWLHRHLESIGVKNVVIDPASVEVNRQMRRRKTDRLDAKRFVTKLIQYVQGDHHVWRVVRVPSEDTEDRRRLHRELERLKKEKTQHRNRIRSLLVTRGIELESFPRDVAAFLEEARDRLGRPVPPQLKGELIREGARLNLVLDQIREVESAQRAALRAPAEESPQAEMVRALSQLRGIGPASAWILVQEVFGWRTFSNRREVGSMAGLTGTPYNTGESDREQGISKAGNRRVRSLMVELGWGWLRLQPESAITKWFERRFAHGGKRTRRIGIVGVARKLLIALWRFLTQGVIPEGAELKRLASAGA